MSLCFLIGERFLWLTAQQIARCTHAIVEHGINGNDFGAFPFPVASVVESSVIPTNSLKDILAVTYDSERMVACPVLYVKNISVASSVSNPTSL